MSEDTEYARITTSRSLCYVSTLVIEYNCMDSRDTPMAAPPTRTVFALATEAVEQLRSLLPLPLCGPRVALICGSGLGGLQNAIRASPRMEIPYADIPHFPRPTGESSLIGLLVLLDTGQTANDKCCSARS